MFIDAVVAFVAPADLMAVIFECTVRLTSLPGLGLFIAEKIQT